MYVNDINKKLIKKYSPSTPKKRDNRAVWLVSFLLTFLYAFVIKIRYNFNLPYVY